jgi:hypothetical protein
LRKRPIQGIMKCNFLFFLLSFALSSKGQTSSVFWIPINQEQITLKGERTIIPQKYRAFHLIDNKLKNILFSAPNKKDVASNNSATIIELPMPDGTLQKFRVVESSVMAPELAAQFPDIKTFNVKGIDDPSVSGKLDWNDYGFHAMLRTVLGDVYIDPYSNNNIEDYITYYTSDFIKDPNKIIPEAGGPIKKSPIKKKKRKKQIKSQK